MAATPTKNTLDVSSRVPVTRSAAERSREVLEGAREDFGRRRRARRAGARRGDGGGATAHRRGVLRAGGEGPGARVGPPSPSDRTTEAPRAASGWWRLPCSSNNKSPVELHENSSYRSIGIFEIRILTVKRKE